MHYYISCSSLLLITVILLPSADAGQDTYSLIGILYSAKHDEPAAGAEVKVVEYKDEKHSTYYRHGEAGVTGNDGKLAMSDLYLTIGHKGYYIMVKHKGVTYESSIFPGPNSRTLDIGTVSLPDDCLKADAKKVVEKVKNVFRRITNPKETIKA